MDQLGLLSVMPFLAMFLVDTTWGVVAENLINSRKFSRYDRVPPERSSRCFVAFETGLDVVAVQVNDAADLANDWVPSASRRPATSHVWGSALSRRRGDDHSVHWTGPQCCFARRLLVHAG
jgi:hypothetical protein